MAEGSGVVTILFTDLVGSTELLARAGDEGHSFNLTRERIRQIEARVMSKLRHPSSGAGARDLPSLSITPAARRWRPLSLLVLRKPELLIVPCGSGGA
jgi:hypothetical protein